METCTCIIYLINIRDMKIINNTIVLSQKRYFTNTYMFGKKQLRLNEENVTENSRINL